MTASLKKEAVLADGVETHPCLDGVVHSKCRQDADLRRHKIAIALTASSEALVKQAQLYRRKKPPQGAIGIALSHALFFAAPLLPFIDPASMYLKLWNAPSCLADGEHGHEIAVVRSAA